eukprot:COSAG06_NODE_45_length_29559_cov_23.840835_27_plen_125_part_00
MNVAGTPPAWLRYLTTARASIMGLNCAPGRTAAAGCATIRRFLTEISLKEPYSVRNVAKPLGRLCRYIQCESLVAGSRSSSPRYRFAALELSFSLANAGHLPRARQHATRWTTPSCCTYTSMAT